MSAALPDGRAASQNRPLGEGRLSFLRSPKPQRDLLPIVMVVMVVVMTMVVVMPIAAMGAREVAVERAGFGGVGRRAEREKGDDGAAEEELGDWEYMVHTS